METWVKPNGVEVEINCDNHKAARELGWVPKSELEAALQSQGIVDVVQEIMPKRRGRPPKE